MSDTIERIRSLAEALAALVAREQRTTREALDSLLDAVRSMQEGTADRRLLRIAAQLRRLRERGDLLEELVVSDYVAQISAALDANGPGDSRLAALVSRLHASPRRGLSAFCDALLDGLIEATGAERGFVLLYVPESTEADVVAARNFRTTDLSLEEYGFSRTVLRNLLDEGAPVLLDDASSDPAYSTEASVRTLALRSIAAAPLRHGERTVGAVYLEENTRPRAFLRGDLELLEAAASLAVLCLGPARLLPAASARASRVFLDARSASSEIVGRDPAILELLSTVRRIVDSPATVLVEGESGTGKELVARALHFEGSRRDRPFTAINCAAIPETLLESELFGHERGAFTGAVERHLGRIEQANGGTVFLDEVSELAYPLQAKLLRLLQSNEVLRLGGREAVRVDVRFVAATSRDLRQMVGRGVFQEALFYRLNVIPIRMPALRERPGDLPLLVEHFLETFSTLYGRRVRIDPEACACLGEYPFPGNIRELENMVHRMVALAEEEIIRLGDLPGEVLQASARRVSIARDPLYRALATPAADFEELRRRRALVRDHLAEQERELARRAVEEAGGSVARAAERLGVHRVTLHKLVRGEGPR